MPSEMDASDKHWHALYVRSRAEKKVLEQLEEIGVEAYLPLITEVRQWSDRRKRVEEPLFKSYVFVRNDAKQHIAILGVYGIIKFVTFEHRPVIVPENQILAIKKFVDDYEKGTQYKMQNESDLKVGQKVRIINGPMKGLTGKLQTIENKRHLVVYIEAVGKYLPVHIPRAKVEPVAEN